MSQPNIEVIVFDTMKYTQEFLDASFKANCDSIESAISKYHLDLEKKAAKIGEGIELKCLVHLYALGKKYDFMAGVRGLGEFVDISNCEYSTLGRLSGGIKKTFSQWSLYTCYGYRLTPSFYTCMEEEQVFTEDQIKSLTEIPKEAKREIKKEKGISASLKNKLLGFANTIVRDLLNAPPVRGLTKQEIGAFRKAYSASPKK